MRRVLVDMTPNAVEPLRADVAELDAQEQQRLSILQADLASARRAFAERFYGVDKPQYDALPVTQPKKEP